MNSPSFPTIPGAPISQTFNNSRPDLYAGDGRHKGIDYGIPTNTPVYACMDGVIEAAGVDNSGYGRRVVIKHANSISLYGHLNKILVGVGEVVISGQMIGYSGGDPTDNIPGDGNSTGAHLHWEIQVNGVPVDPDKYCLEFFPIGARVAKCTSSVGLNVRSSPDTNAQILYTLKIGEIVKVADQSKGWAKLRSLRPAYCSVGYLEFADLAAPAGSLSDAEKLALLWDLHPELHK